MWKCLSFTSFLICFTMWCIWTRKSFVVCCAFADSSTKNNYSYYENASRRALNSPFRHFKFSLGSFFSADSFLFKILTKVVNWCVLRVSSNKRKSPSVIQLSTLKHIFFHLSTLFFVKQRNSSRWKQSHWKGGRRRWRLSSRCIRRRNRDGGQASSWRERGTNHHRRGRKTSRILNCRCWNNWKWKSWSRSYRASRRSR